MSETPDDPLFEHLDSCIDLIVNKNPYMLVSGSNLRPDLFAEKKFIKSATIRSRRRVGFGYDLLKLCELEAYLNLEREAKACGATAVDIKEYVSSYIFFKSFGIKCDLYK